jgi:REP element-mobilizing transposase RayT
MARPIRFQGAGLVYHVMARGNNKMAIFLDDLDYARFLDMLADVIDEFEIDCWVICGMPNHFHLVIRTRQPNLSLAMGHLDGRFAQWWNKRHAHIGHVFQGRFKGQVVESAVYLVRLCRYVLLNPVRAGLCFHPRDWPWSSYKDLISGQPSRHVDVESLVRHIDADSASVLERLITYVEPETDPEMAAFIRGDRRVIGTPAFAAQFRQQARAASPEVPARERRTGTRPLVDILAAAIREGEGLAAGVRRARESGGYALAEIARCSGLSENAVARMAGGRMVRRRPGTRKRRIGDLAPTSGGTET